MIFELRVRGAIVVAAAIIGLVTLAAPARADQCDDIAKRARRVGIDGLKVNFKAANIIYLTHPAAKDFARLPRPGQSCSNELYAKGDRKPTPQFYRSGCLAAAIIFTVTKDDTTTGATRCLKRMGLLRGDKVTMRYQRAQHRMRAHQDGRRDLDHAPKDEYGRLPPHTPQ